GLASNKFTGKLSFVSTLSTRMETLTINNNQFSGSIPSIIGSRFLRLQYLDASHNYLSGPISILPWFKMDLSNNYLTGLLKGSASLDSRLAVNCFTQPKCPGTQPNCSSTQRTAAECTAFCGGASACDGRGICYPDGPSLVPTCLCEPGYVQIGRFHCFAQGWDRRLFVSMPVLPIFTILTKGTQRQTVGKFMARPVTLFAYPKRLTTGCGVELAFSVNFTFCLVPQNGTAGSNGFAFVIAAKGKVGKADDSRVKPETPLLQRELLLCTVLQPSAQQSAFSFGFVASTTVMPFQMHSIVKSAMRTGK
ncbi:unnamed protein product, partial [Closterium sp. NIES-65]